MSDSDETREITDWRTESRWYRRKPGAGWLLAFLAIPALLAAIGLGTVHASKTDAELTLPSIAPSATLTAPTVSGGQPTVAAPAVGFPPFSIARGGNGFTVAGELPSADVKAALLDSITQGLPGLSLTDKLTVTPGVKAPEFGGLGGLFSAGLEIPDFNLKLENDVITLTGNAPSQALKDAAQAAAAAAWPNVKIVNDIQIVAASSTAAPPPGPAPGPGAGGGACTTLQADITSLLKTPINFDTDGAGLAANSSQLVAQIASKVKACPDVRVVVTGYTDNTGNDAINIPLSGSRAKAVADALVGDGIAGGSVTSSGAGSAKPVASNDSPAGRAQNRRVEITVS